MTNFEKYKEEILRYTIGGFALTKDGEVTSCVELDDCTKCKFEFVKTYYCSRDLIDYCLRDLTEWLYQEAE